MFDHRMLFAVVLLTGVAYSADSKPSAPPPAAADVDALIKQLGDDDYAKREAASRSLVALGEKARKPLEKLLKETKDADLNSRADAILGVLSMPKDFAALNAAEREIGKLPFKSSVSEDGKTVNFNNYGHGDGFISDFGNIRVVIEEQPYNGTTNGSITTSGGGRSSISAGSFKCDSANGVHNISFRGISWKVEGSLVKVAGEETGFGGATNRVIFLDKAGKFKKRVDMAQEKDAKK